MNNLGLKACRFIWLILSAILCLIALILLIIGLATPSWLIVQYRLSGGLVEEHRHGLWLDCVLRGTNPYSMQSTYFPTSGGMGDQCEYKWINVDYAGSFGSPYGPYGGGSAIDPYNTGIGAYAMSTMYENDFAQHRFLGWHVTTMVMLLIAITAGVFALICSCCVLWTGLCSPLVALLEFVAFLCSAIGCIVFFVNANRPEIRYVQIPTSAERWRVIEYPDTPPRWFPPPNYGRPGIWGGDGGFGTFVGAQSPWASPPWLNPGFPQEQIRGFSFDLSLASVFIFLLSFLVGVIGTVTVFMHAHRDHRRRHLASKTYPKSEIATISSPANDNSATFVRAHSPAIDV